MELDEVLDAKSYLSRIREWPPIPEEANPERWLAGFTDADRGHAVALLDSFVFISARQTKKLFTSAIHALSTELTAADTTYVAKRDRWRNFLRTAIIAAPTGEDPNPTDSGFIFQRLARTALRVPEANIVSVADVRETIERDGARPIILVDDFAGSGNQLLETWHRKMWRSSPQSLAELTADVGLEVYYVPLVCTTLAAERIANDAAGVHLRACHIVTDVYGAGHPDSVVFPVGLRPTAADFIKNSSQHAGITEYPRGFWDLELALAFDHSIPDANLGVLWSEEGGWFPLRAKS